MAKVKVTGLKKVRSDIRKFITKELRQKELRAEVGDIVVQSIRATKYGTPAASTKKWRKRYDKLNKTHDTYRQNNINVTFTGELLNDLAGNVKAKSTGGQFVYVVEHSSKLHKKYNGVSGKIGKRVKYSTISDGIINKHGYDYLNISKGTLKKVVSHINRTLEIRFKSFNA